MSKFQSKSSSLVPFNTFGLPVHARQIIVLDNYDVILNELEKVGVSDYLILGGGSNVLFTQPFAGTILLNKLLGKAILGTEGDFVYVEAGAGENWHDFVLWCIENDFGGLENLSLIPGKVGAAPIQNIGAYGVEMKDHFHQLEVVDVASGLKSIFNADDCNFGYRDSQFKQAWKGKYLITKVVFKLKRNNHIIKKQYGAIQQILAQDEIDVPSILDISKAIIKIRQSKLPDPSVLGNAGSFFKNPVLGADQFLEIQHKNPNLPFYKLPGNLHKIPAAWLIEQCGWKGKRVGNTGCYSGHSLIIVNYGEATGKEIWNFAERVQSSVMNKFGIQIQPEVNVI